MLFNSFEYIFLFLPFVFFTFFSLINHSNTIAKLFLVFSSLFFYAWWKALYIFILLFSIVFNFFVGNLIDRNNANNISAKRKKQLLIFGIFTNIFLLVYFKYYDFFVSNINHFFDTQIPYLNLALPLAISFFTFQQIAYLVDKYRGETEEHNFLNYLLFVTFFPQLIAGPIVHHKEMLPQFSDKNNWKKNYKNIALGLFIFSLGLFKKVMIADTFARWANQGFDIAQHLNMIEAWVTSLSYTFQLYFDFSGYTDMAIGAALLFNIRLPINFFSPYKALTIQEFWRRWHITLTRFLTQYIYIPIGGNRKGLLRTYFNILIVFLIGGIWHGAGWTFLFWGLLHGFALVIHRIWSTYFFKLPALVAWFLTFNFVNIAWIFFRAKNFGDAIKVLDGMFHGKLVIPASLEHKLPYLQTFGIEFGNHFQNIQADKSTFLLIVLGFVITLAVRNSTQLSKDPLTFTRVTVSATLFIISILSIHKFSEFIYFNF